MQSIAHLQKIINRLSKIANDNASVVECTRCGWQDYQDDFEGDECTECPECGFKNHFSAESSSGDNLSEEEEEEAEKGMVSRKKINKFLNFSAFKNT